MVPHSKRGKTPILGTPPDRDKNPITSIECHRSAHTTETIQVTEHIEAPPQIRIEQRPANPTPHSASPAPEEVPGERNEDEYERLLNGPIEDIRRAAARDPTLGFFFRVLDDIKDQLLEGITAQIQVQEPTGYRTSTVNIRQQVESAAQNAWTAANSSQLGVNEQIKTQNAIDKLSQQMDTIVVAMGAMETLQETLQVVEEGSQTSISWTKTTNGNQKLNPLEHKTPSGPPSRGNTPPPRTPKPHRKEGGTKDEIPKGARAKKPEAFNGKRQEAEIFLMKMEIYFNDYGTAFDNNRKMATFLTNMGEGEAAKWAKPLLRKILDENHTNTCKLERFEECFPPCLFGPHEKGKSDSKYSQTPNITQDTSTFSLEKWMEVSIRIDDLLFTGRSLRDNGSSGNQDRKFQPRTTQAKVGIVPSEVIKRGEKKGDASNVEEGDTACENANSRNGNKNPKLSKEKKQRLKNTCPETLDQESEKKEACIIPKEIRTNCIYLYNGQGIMDPIPTLVDSGSSKNFLDINFAQNNKIPLIPLVNPRTVIAIDGKELPKTNCIYLYNGQGIMDPIPTLVDSGSSKNFLDINFAQNNKIPLIPLVNPRTVIAIDGKELPNKIKNKATLEVEIEGWTFDITFFVMDLGDTDMILGLDWLQEADPDINWKTLEISWKGRPITAKAGKDLPTIPEEFMEFIDVFSEELFKKLPEHRSFDCNIDFAEGSDLPKPAKVSPLANREQNDKGIH
ncbi:Retroviral aspartyl protease [Ceratobasidium sp. AG-Ba]|nr:Retroviral aspartyl protease [Ceratobasidium sp. AG-Ba]